MDPTTALKSFKESWESAKAASKVKCRFHDLRHSACTKLVERGVPLPVIASLLGWSAGTTVRMARRYGHISVEAQRNAVGRLEPEQSSAGADERTKRSVDAAPQ
jgi:integrase